MKRTFLLSGAFFCTIGLAFPAYGVEMADEPEPVESAILLFEPDLFVDPSSVALPAWIARVGFEGGDVGGGSSAWRVAKSAPVGTGKLWVELDRSVLDENLALSVVGERKVPSDMVIQLWDGQGRIVALDLFGNITAAALESRTDTFVVPLWKYPSATRIVLRRVSGATTIYGLALIPVVMEQDIGTNTVEALQFARMLGDLLSPENELVRRVRVISNGRFKAGSTGQDELVVSVPSSPVYKTHAVKKEHAKNNMISAPSKTPISSRKGAGLLLWNKLGSEGEVLSSEYGVNGSTSGSVTYQAVQHGNGAGLGSGNSRVFFNRPFGGAFPDAGCIEFWWKAGHDENISAGSYSSERMPLYISSDDRRPDGWPSFQISVVCGSHPRSYNNKAVIGMGIHDTQIGQNVGVASTYDFNFLKGDLIHLAIVWDKSWSPARLKVYYNGVEAVPVTSDAVLAERLIATIQRQLPTYSYDLELHRYSRRTDGAATQFAPDGYVDNLKIWNFAKTDFSDRFIEGVGEQGSDADVSLSKGLLAKYSFTNDEGARVSDQSGKKRDGKIVDAEWTADGRFGGAMRFGPTNSYVVASDEGLPMGGAVRSIAFWMKLGANRNLSNPLAYGTLRYNQNFSMGMDWRLGRNSICIGQHGAVNVASKKFETGRWYHIVYTYGGGSEHRFYIDGVEDPLAVREIRAPLETVSSGSLYLGLRAGLDSATHSFDGWLDEVMIYDRVLEPAEVRRLYEPGGLGINSMDQKSGVFFVAGNDLYRMSMDGTDCVDLARSGRESSK